MNAPAVEKEKRGPGRPKKEEAFVPGTDEVTPERKKFANPALVVPSQIVDIKHIVRVFSYNGQFYEEGAKPASVVEDYLNQNYFAQGYTLYKIEHIKIVNSREDVPIGSQMLYILVKYAE